MQQEEHERSKRRDDDSSVVSAVHAGHRHAGELERESGYERDPRASTELGRKQIHANAGDRELNQQHRWKDA